MEHFDILLTDSANAVGRQVRESLRRLGLSAALCDPSGKGDFKTFHSQDTANFIKRVKEIADGTGATMIIPIFHPEVIAAHREAFPGITIPTEEAGKITALDDKLSACAIAASLGIPQPRIYPSPEAIESYPVVFKRSTGHGGASVYFPSGEASLRKLIANSAPGKYLVSEEIAGGDWSVDAVRFGEKFIWGAYRTLLPKAKGTSVVRESVDAPQLAGYLKRMLDHIGYNGVCGADFRVDARGRAYFLECNPRFCGGLDTLLASGLDLPALLLSEYARITPQGAAFPPAVAACPHPRTASPPPAAAFPHPGTAFTHIKAAFTPGKVTALKEDVDIYLDYRRRHSRLDEDDLRICGMAETVSL